MPRGIYPRKKGAKGTTRKRVYHRKPLIVKHKFFTERTIQAGFIVVRIDDYELTPNHRGGFSPKAKEFHPAFNPTGGVGGNMSFKGMLWPTHELAAKAAEFMVTKYPRNSYGVFRMTDLAESSVPPVRIVKV